MSLLIRLMICLMFIGMTLYKSIDQLNSLTHLRLAVPHITKQLKEIEEKNLELRYQIDLFENPLHLMELARKSEYAHMKYPSLENVIILKEKSSCQIEDTCAQ